MYLEQRRQAMLQLHLSDHKIQLPTKVRLILKVWRYPRLTSSYLQSLNMPFRWHTDDNKGDLNHTNMTRKIDNCFVRCFVHITYMWFSKRLLPFAEFIKVFIIWLRSNMLSNGLNTSQGVLLSITIRYLLGIWQLIRYKTKTYWFSAFLNVFLEVNHNEDINAIISWGSCCMNALNLILFEEPGHVIACYGLQLHLIWLRYPVEWHTHGT